jgi:hypothetical protein
MQRIRLSVRDLGNWAQGNEQVKTVLVVVLVFGEPVEHLSCPLGVSDIRNLLVSRNLDDVFQHGRDVVLTHLLPVKRPIF